jgi:hypothetical protein
MPAVFFLCADGGHDACRLSRLQDADNPVGFGSREVGQDEVIAPAFGCIQNRRCPFLRPVGYPVLELSCDVAQDIPADRIQITVGSEETDDSLFLLKRLDEAIEQNAVKATILEADAILVMLV